MSPACVFAAGVAASFALADFLAFFFFFFFWLVGVTGWSSFPLGVDASPSEWDGEGVKG